MGRKSARTCRERALALLFESKWQSQRSTTHTKHYASEHIGDRVGDNWWISPKDLMSEFWSCLDKTKKTWRYCIKYGETFYGNLNYFKFLSKTLGWKDVGFTNILAENESNGRRTWIICLKKMSHHLFEKVNNLVEENEPSGWCIWDSPIL